MSRPITWNGTPDEALALLHALRAHCACHVEQGRTVAPSRSHLMLAHDQRAIDGLLFMRRMAARLLAEEFGVTELRTGEERQQGHANVQSVVRLLEPDDARVEINLGR